MITQKTVWIAGIHSVFLQFNYRCFHKGHRYLLCASKITFSGWTFFNLIRKLAIQKDWEKSVSVFSLCKSYCLSVIFFFLLCLGVWLLLVECRWLDEQLWRLSAADSAICWHGHITGWPPVRPTFQHIHLQPERRRGFYSSFTVTFKGFLEEGPDRVHKFQKKKENK